MLFPEGGFGGVVIGNDEGILLDPQIAFQATEKVLGQMARIPLGKWLTQTLAELMDEGLGHQGQAHLPGANIQIECAGSFPTQVLLEAEELLNVPAVGKIPGQGGHLRTGPGASKAFEMIVLGPLAGALNITIARLDCGRAAGLEGLGGNGEPGPMRLEVFRRERSISVLEGGGLSQWRQQVEGRVRPDVIEEFSREVLAVGDDEGALALRVGQDLLGQWEQFLGGGAQVAGTAGVDQTKGLAGGGVQQEEDLRLFGRGLADGGAALDQVAFGVADQAVRVQRQNLAREVAAGPAQFAQGDLELLRLLDGMGGQQVMEGAVGGQPRQAVGQLKALVAQGTVVAQAGPAQRGFMHQMQGQTRGQVAAGGLPRPSSEQIPTAQAQVLGHQQPEAQETTRNLVGQGLAHLAFDAGRIRLGEALAFSGALHGQRRRRVFGVECVEFFFAGRNRR